MRCGFSLLAKIGREFKWNEEVKMKVHCVLCTYKVKQDGYKCAGKIMINETK